MTELANEHLRKILHLVLYSPSTTYDCMADVTRKLYALHAHEVDTWYYYCDPEVNTCKHWMKLVDHPSLPGKRTCLSGIIDKTIKALEMLDTNQSEYAAVVRSNVSTVINFDHLLDALDNAEEEIVYGGPHIMHESTVGGERTLRFAQGTCIILGHWAIELLLQKQHLLRKDIEDYRVFALLLKQEASIYPQQIETEFAYFENGYNISDASGFFPTVDLTLRIANKTLCLWFAVHTLCGQRIALRDQVVLTVLYHTKDITDVIWKDLQDYKSEWTLSGGDNGTLDQIFGDPAPNVPKQLHIITTDQVFSQNADFTFYCEQNTHTLRVR